MFDFVRLDWYTPIYYHIILIVVLITFLHTQALQINSRRNIAYITIMGALVFCFVVLYMGFRPISKVFVDMPGYAYFFERAQEGNPMDFDIDFGFFQFVNWSSKLMSVTFFFFVCALLYVLPLWTVSKRWYKKYSFYGFLFLITSFSFWTYGTNGIRNGIATSLFLLALSYANKKYILIVLLIVSCSFHKTMVLPTFAYILTIFYNNTSSYLKGWLIAIILSLLFGGFWVSFFANLGLNDQRIESYLTNDVNEAFSNFGFRWDFLLYSATGMFAGWYFIIKRGFVDKFYHRLFNVYIISNTLWVLLIRANFSNRFAYLSWFMLGIIIIYPFLKHNFFKNQHAVIGRVLLIYFIFTYMMNVILIKT